MIKRSITFRDLEGNPRTEDFYFNLTVPEVTDLELSVPNGGIGKYYEKIVEARDAGLLLKEFKKLISLSYGERDADGKTFNKIHPVTGRQLGESFLQTDAYSVLFLEMFGQDSNDDEFTKFLSGVLPAELLEKAQAAQAAGQLPTAEGNQEVPVNPRTVEQYSREELLAMDQALFDQLAGTDPMSMSQSVLQVAMQRKSNAQNQI